MSIFIYVKVFLYRNIKLCTLFLLKYNMATKIKIFLFMMSSKIVAIVGNSNVGKSSLFNLLTKTKDSLVFDRNCTTVDQVYGVVKFEESSYIVADTGGGFSKEDNSEISEQVLNQSRLLIQEADLVYFVLDANGISSVDYTISEFLRYQNKSVILVINKIDKINPSSLSDFYQLGFKNLVSVSCVHNRGIKTLIKQTFKYIGICGIEDMNASHGIKFCLVGRPNVGKSTLTNFITKSDKSIVSCHPGTTTNSISSQFLWKGSKYTIIDTAGIRRNKSCRDVLEKFSIQKTITSILKSDVSILLISSTNSVASQDFRLFNLIKKLEKPVLIVLNKSDLLTLDSQKVLIQSMKEYLHQKNIYVHTHLISSLEGKNINSLFKSINNIFNKSKSKISSSSLTKALINATESHKPTACRGGRSRISLKYAHIGDFSPLTIVIHGNNVKNLQRSYKSYLLNFFVTHFKLIGVPLKLKFNQKTNTNILDTL